MLHRVQKLLAQAGIGSRRYCEQLVREGRVKVNGIVVKLGDKASENDIIQLDGQRVRFERKVYIMLYKKKGYVSTTEEPFGMKKVVDVVQVPERVYPVGRLDRSAEGLLLLTNDGELANALTHPRHGVEKEYFVKLSKPVSQGILKKISQGVKIEGRLASAKCSASGKDAVFLTLKEGRRHIVKKLFGRLGYVVSYLRRVRIGSLRLEGVKGGKWRYLTDNEVAALKRCAIRIK